MAADRSIHENVEALRLRLARACGRSGRDPAAVTIIAVTKNHPHQAVRDAMGCGLKDFGENRVQEAAGKLAQLADCRASFKLHFIGHLQSNKAAEVLGIADVIHSVDTLRLAGILNGKAAGKVPVLIQVNLAGEASKSGFSEEGLDGAVRSIRALPNLQPLGLMTIAPLVDNAQDVRPLFARLRKLNQSYGFSELSMGMSDDFEVAVEEGSTMVRIGRAIFGERS